MSSEPLTPQDDKREELIARRKAEVWLIAIVMTASFCAGTTIVFLITWLLLN